MVFVTHGEINHLLVTLCWIAHGKPKRMEESNGNDVAKLKNGILNDELPRDRTKYVRFSNLASINQKMVILFKVWFSETRKRAVFLRGILEEMLRSSNERYDIEDSGRFDQR